MAVVRLNTTTQLLGLCILAAIVGHASVDAAFGMNDTCAICATGFIADPSNCQGYGYCNKGKLQGTATCGSGLLWDNENGMCNYAAQVDCVTSLATMCNGLDNVLKPNPDDCTKYCSCVNGKLEGCASCPKNQVYNPSTESCVWSSMYTCPVSSPCRLMPNNQFVADPTSVDCSGYLRCVGGTGIPGTCTDYFNPLTGQCTTTPQTCSGSNGGNTGGNTGNTPTINIPTLCAKVTGATDKTPVYVSDEATCGGYVACTSTTTGAWQKCEFGTHFQPSTVSSTGKALCVSPLSYKCPYDRCNNINMPYMTSIKPTANCSYYTVCKNQVSIGAPQQCASGDYTYYNEQLGGCSKTPPGFAICTA